MKLAILTIAGVAVAISAVPAPARSYTKEAVCTKQVNGRCVAWRDLTRRQAKRQAYRVGYAFGPSYAYTALTALPRPVVARYGLRNNFRYVSRDGFVYVVNPRTYRVVRVIPR